MKTKLYRVKWVDLKGKTHKGEWVPKEFVEAWKVNSAPTLPKGVTWEIEEKSVDA